MFLKTTKHISILTTIALFFSLLNTDLVGMHRRKNQRLTNDLYQNPNHTHPFINLEYRGEKYPISTENLQKINVLNDFIEMQEDFSPSENEGLLTFSLDPLLGDLSLKNTDVQDFLNLASKRPLEKKDIHKLLLQINIAHKLDCPSVEKTCVKALCDIQLDRKKMDPIGWRKTNWLTKNNSKMYFSPLLINTIVDAVPTAVQETIKNRMLTNFHSSNSFVLHSTFVHLLQNQYMNGNEYERHPEDFKAIILSVAKTYDDYYFGERYNLAENLNLQQAALYCRLRHEYLVRFESSNWKSSPIFIEQDPEEYNIWNTLDKDAQEEIKRLHLVKLGSAKKWYNHVVNHAAEITAGAAIVTVGLAVLRYFYKRNAE